VSQLHRTELRQVHARGEHHEARGYAGNSHKAVRRQLQRELGKAQRRHGREVVRAEVEAIADVPLGCDGTCSFCMPDPTPDDIDYIRAFPSSPAYSFSGPSEKASKSDESTRDA
jgi:hypothetical protein